MQKENVKLVGPSLKFEYYKAQQLMFELGGLKKANSPHK